MKTLKKILYYASVIVGMLSFLLILSAVGAHERDAITTHELIIRCISLFALCLGAFAASSFTYEEKDYE